MVCNTALRDVTPEEYRTRVPAALQMPAELVHCCPGCGRVYWPGSHTTRMLCTLASAFPEWKL
jgi:uncharacterized protein with PIN domain